MERPESIEDSARALSAVCGPGLVRAYAPSRRPSPEWRRRTMDVPPAGSVVPRTGSVYTYIAPSGCRSRSHIHSSCLRAEPLSVRLIALSCSLCRVLQRFCTSRPPSCSTRERARARGPRAAIDVLAPPLALRNFSSVLLVATRLNTRLTSTCGGGWVPGVDRGQQGGADECSPRAVFPPRRAGRVFRPAMRVYVESSQDERTDAIHMLAVHVHLCPSVEQMR